MIVSSACISIIVIIGISASISVCISHQCRSPVGGRSCRLRKNLLALLCERSGESFACHGASLARREPIGGATALNK